MTMRDRAGLLKDSFQSQYYLRWHMTLLLGATGGAAALISRGLLVAGLDAMRWRYPVAALLSYGIFLVLVRLWLWYAGGIRFRRDHEWDLDFPELPEGGTGLDLPVPDGFDLGLDEFLVPVVVLLAMAGMCLAGAYVIWAAPEILAEIAVEAILAASLHQGVLRARNGRWLWAALSRTWIILAVAVALVFAGGWGLEKYCPGSTKLRQAMACPANPETRW